MDILTTIEVRMFTINDMEVFGVPGADHFVQRLCSYFKHSECSKYIECKKYKGRKFEDCKEIRVSYRRQL